MARSPTKEIEFNYVSQFLQYDEKSPTGLIYITSKKKGQVAGIIDGNYYKVFLKKHNNVLAHRLVWLLTRGSIDSKLCIDHLDGNGYNNKADNLRLIPKALNARNVTTSPKHGFRGVYKNRYMWCASWVIDGKKREKCFSIDRLGCDKAKALAIEHRKSMFNTLEEVGYTSNHLCKNHSSP